MHQLPIGILAVVGFLVGLVASFWVAGVFGFPAPLFWASVVTAFVVGVLFLQKPKLYLVIAFLYYGMFLNGVLFGTIHIPLPFARLYDELVLVVPLAYIVMRSVNRSLPRGATIFPLAYLLIAYIGYKMNGVPRLPWFRAVLSYSRFYIYWYFCRALGPWSAKEKTGWFWLVVGFAWVQFFANVIWQGNIILTRHPDYSTGTMGGAHTVGYVSGCALFLLVAWFITRGRNTSLGQRLGVLIITALIAYNLIFLTDTKHALLVFPVAALPTLLHPSIPARYRIGFVLGLGVFALASWFYMSYGVYGMHAPFRDYVRAIMRSGKGYLYRTILWDLPRQNPIFFLVGAGPGNFCSTAAIHAWRPLAVKYVIPYLITALRSGGATAEASVLGSPSASSLVLLGEFGWLGAITYYGFWLYALVRLWKEARRSPVLDWETGQRLALCSCLIFLLIIGFLSDLMPFAQIYLSVWLLVAMYWDKGRESPLNVTHTSQIPRHVGQQRVRQF